MARIWYSVFGEGYGHSTRSAPIIEALQKKHALLVTGFNKSYEYLKKRFPKIVHRIDGPGFVYNSNTIDRKATFLEFMNSLPENSKKNTFHIFNLIKRFKPDLIISDFEPASHYFAYFLKIPIINIDNMSVLSKCEIDVKKEDMVDYLSALSVIKVFNPQADYNLILTFKRFKSKEKNVLFFPPILREQVLEKKSRAGDFILVYSTTKSNFSGVFRELKKISEKFVIYGSNENKLEGNFVFKKFSDEGFLDDLANCKGVLMNGGFSTISEAIYLDKPMFIVPAKNQYEQKFNGLTIEKLGFGVCKEEAGKKEIESFLANLNFYKGNLEKVPKWDNSRIILKVEGLVDELAKTEKPVFEFARKVEDYLRPKKYERTLTIIKPDAVQKKFIGEVIRRLEKKGINPIAMKMVKIDKKRANVFYSHLKGKVPQSVFNSIVRYMTSGRVVLIVWQGNGVVKKIREICGPTNPKKAAKKQIRSLSDEDMEKKFRAGKAVRNIIHSSGTIEEAKKEIEMFFYSWEINGS
jgi:uncharacterized protein (TIGR00661 family)